MARISLSIYRLKDTLVSAFPDSDDGVIDPDAKRVGANIAMQDAKARVYVAKKDRHLPDWAQFLKGEIPADLFGMLSPNAANSALLVILIDGALFAIAFGYGRQLIDEEAIDRTFGLRTALSIIDPDQMRHVGYKEVDARTLFGDLQSTQATQFYNFSLNPDEQLLRGIYGGVLGSHDKWATHAVGSDCLQINPMIKFKEIPRLLRWVRSIEAGKQYTKNFGWIDHVVQVSDRALLGELKIAVPKYISAGGTGVQVATPEPVDPRTGATYHFGRAKPASAAFPEPSLAYLRQSATPHSSHDQLSKHKLFVLSPNGKIMHQWSVWRCLSGEIRHNRKNYIIQAGDFYTVESSYETKVDTRLSKVLASTARCPPWDGRRHATEGAYNKDVLHPSVTQSVCLDAKCLTTYRGRGSLELCDVFEHRSGTTTMFFVKKYSGSSSPLSHLAAQASVTAEALRDDPGLRADAVGKWPLVASAFATQFNPTNVEIRICIAARKKTLVDLPFFAKLTLAQRSDRIRSLGYSVAIEMFDHVP